MRIHYLIPAAGIALLACGLPHEDFTAVERSPVPLLASLPSYSRVASVRAVLHGTAWRVLEQSSLRPADTRPPFSILSVAVPFHDHGHDGELYLLFFNDRLASTGFAPADDPTTYERSLGPLFSNSTQSETRIGNLRAWRTHTKEGRLCFYLADERLLAQQDRWVMKFS